MTGGRRERSSGMAVDAGGFNVGDGNVMARPVRGDMYGNPDGGITELVEMH